MSKLINSVIIEEEGQGLVEYSLIISIVILLTIISVIFFGESLAIIYSNKIVEKLP